MENLHKFRPIIVEEESGGAGLQWEKLRTDEIEFNSDDGFVFIEPPMYRNVLGVFTLASTKAPTEDYICNLTEDETGYVLVDFYGSDLGIPYKILLDGVIGNYTILPSGDSNGYSNTLNVDWYILNDNGEIVDETHLLNLPRIED